MVVTFCGHSSVSDAEELKIWLIKVVESLINQGADKFYLGGYGAFDSISKQVVYELKQKYSSINSVLVIPYLDRKYDLNKYDYSIYPSLETVPKKFAISKRNEWMIQESDVVIAYVIHGFGGASKTLEYAKRKKKYIINYPETK